MDADVVPAKKLGLSAFLFFLGKGLLWLLIPAVIYTWGCCSCVNSTPRDRSSRTVSAMSSQ